MNGSCNKFLSRSRFTCNQNRRITWRNFGDARQYRLQSRRSPDDLFKHGGFVDFLSQRHVFLLQPLLGPPAILYISAGDIPAEDLALVVADGIVPSEKPKVASIPGAHTLFQFEGQASRQRPLCKRSEPRDIVRMRRVGPAAQPLVEAEAEILKRGA